MLGLSQYYAHVEKDPRVLKLMIAEANSVIDQIGDAPKVDINTQGWSRTGIESYSVMEPMIRIYKLTGDKRYLDFCTYLIKKGGCRGANIFQESLDNVRPRLMGNGYPKAYEMLSVYEGLVEYYRCTGEEKWKQATLNLFENLKKYEITIIGNGGADYPYYPKWRGEAWDDTALEQTNPKIERMMETCAGVTWMKLCSQILRITGDASAVDFIEKYVYNGLIGAMKPGGNGFSYVNLLNGQKVLIPFIDKSTDNMMIQMLKQQGAGYSTSSGEVQLFNDTTGEILTTIAEHAASGAFNTFKLAGYPANFLNAGQCIFAIDSTAGATWMGADAPLIDIAEEKLIPFELAVLPVPQFDPEQPQMISQGPSVCVFNKTDPQEVLASWLFAQYLLTNDVQIAYSQTEGYIPVTSKAQESPAYQDYLSRCGEDNTTHYLSLIHI